MGAWSICELTPMSSWLHCIGIDCNGCLFTWFKRAVPRDQDELPPEDRTYIPHFCCIYKGACGSTGQKLFALLEMSESKGRADHAFLYRKLPYFQVGPPNLPCPGCHTAVALTSSKNPACDSDTVTFTAVVSNSDGSLIPTGTVSFFDGSTLLATQTLDATGTATFTPSPHLSIGTHTIKAVYNNPRGFQTSQQTLSQVVNATDVSCGVCPPSTLHCAITNQSNCSCAPTTITLTFDGTSKWTGSGAFGTCGRTITISWYNDGSLGCGTHHKLDISFSDSCIQSPTTLSSIASGCTCVPLNIPFQNTFNNGACGCNIPSGVVNFVVSP